MSLAPHIRWPKCWSFNFGISPSNEYSGLTSFRTDSFDNLIIGLIFLIELIKCREHFINLFGKVDNIKYLWI